MNAKDLTTDQKIEIISKSDEINIAVKILIATMKDCKIPNYITISFKLGDEKYELKLSK